MRRCLMWIMICLLPLRLWAGDAMAVQHVPPTAAHAAMATVAALAPDAHPCHTAEAAEATDTAATATHHAMPSEAETGHHGACGDCSVCHGPLAGLALPSWMPPALASARPHTIGWSALSANGPPHLKPPRA